MDFLVIKKYLSGPLAGKTETRLLVNCTQPPKVGDVRVITPRTSAVYLQVKPVPVKGYRHLSR